MLIYDCIIEPFTSGWGVGTFELPPRCRRLKSLVSSDDVAPSLNPMKEIYVLKKILHVEQFGVYVRIGQIYRLVQKASDGLFVLLQIYPIWQKALTY